MHTIKLKPNREKTARQRHPWIFSGALANIPRDIGSGEIVRVLDSTGRFGAYGYFNSKSQIIIRLLEWDEGILVDNDWWRAKIKAAFDRRAAILADGASDTCRLVFGESDFLPGLIVDKYGSHIVIQALTAGIERIKGEVVSILNELLHPAGVYDKGDPQARSLDGLSASSGNIWGAEPPDRFVISENSLKFCIDIKTGQKTAFYIDQRDNRAAAASLARGRDLLDCFSYTGAFSVYALAAGARSVTLVESSRHSLEMAKENFKINNVDSLPIEMIEDDVFRRLRQFRDEGRTFDMVILDPPKFAPTRASLKKALLAYKDINMLAAQVLRPGGILVTFSCSGAVDQQTLQTVLFWASTDSGRQIQVTRTLSQGTDHPRLVTFPESEYLKGFVCRVV